jgi:hypothetical protein
MLRVRYGAVAIVAVVWAGLVSADDSKKDKDHGKSCMHATVSKLDTQKGSITVKITDREGKEQEKTFQTSSDTDYRDSNGKSAKLSDFKAGDDVLITQKDGKLTEIKEDNEATITKVDPKAGTVTLKMKDKDGKDVEKVFKLTQDAEYIDSTGRVATLDVFRSGDQVLVIESEGHIKELKKSSDKKSSDAATASKNRTDEKKSSNR